LTILQYVIPHVIPRVALQPLLELAAGYPVVTITGPRQSGKTTLAQAAFPSKPYVSLEEPYQREMADSDPKGFLERFPAGTVIDEAQRCPALFSYIQARVDRDRQMGQFVLISSQKLSLLSQVRQSWAGRAGILHLLPFSLAELKAVQAPIPGLAALLLKGLYPPLYDRPLPPQKWYADYSLTYLERDLRQLLMVRDLTAFQRFLRMCAARTAQLLNLSSIASDCGISHNTARSWLSVLEASYIVFLLPPHTRNFGKRLVKTPKLYFLDTGLAAWLLNIQDAAHLAIHPQRGALFESLVISELLKARFNRGLSSNLFFWRDNTGNEVDLLIEQGQTLIPVEIKSGQTIASDFTSGLEKWRRISGVDAPGYLAYGGTSSMNHKGIRVLAWSDLSELYSH
jgi:predicted AAA+ superfamily ATPase